MSWQKLNKLFYTYRVPISLLFLGAILYFVAFSWFVTPSLALVLGWRPDTTLIVLPDVEGNYTSLLQAGDIVLEVDGHPVQRGHLIFQPPKRPIYTFTLERDGQVLPQEVSVAESDLYRMLVLSTGGLAMAFWGIGLLTIFFARPEQTTALHVGLAWQLIGTGLASGGPSQLGAPGAWLVGHVLIFLFPLIMLFLAYIPRQTPLPMTAQKLLKLMVVITICLAILAAIEAVWLFPTKSLHSLTGVSTLTTLSTLTGLSVLAAIIILFGRLRQAPIRSYERQQLGILFVCLLLAVIPLFFFLVLPAGQYIFVPYPFVYSLLLLIPASYFFVLHRHGHLKLDSIFSRLITVVMLVLAVGMAYATGAYLLDKIIPWTIGDIGKGGFALVILSVTLATQKQVQSAVDLLLYGGDQIEANTVQEAKSRLSANPEPATVADVVTQVAAHLSVAHAAVLTKDHEQYVFLVGNILGFTVSDSPQIRSLKLRSGEAEWIDDFPQWVELSVPIVARGDILGLFLLSRPLNGYFNARQVESLIDIADILAFGLLVISLVESMNALSRQVLYEKELQRQQIATEIHNEPLHTLTLVAAQLHQVETNPSVREAVQAIRQVTKDLRRIIAGLRPSPLKESINWMVQQVIREFAETHDHLDVQVQLDIHSDSRAPDQTKFACYYILTEALNNISKHARASQVSIVLHYDDEVLRLLVCDNGVGGKAILRPFTEVLRGQHLGVADMYRWASIGGGQLTIRPNEPSGTIVDLTLPLSSATSDFLS